MSISLLTLPTDVFIAIVCAARSNGLRTAQDRRLLSSLYLTCHGIRKVLDSRWDIIVEAYTTITTITCTTWYRFCGLQHRVGGPAIYSDIHEEWYHYGKRHRDGDLPAYTYHHHRREGDVMVLDHVYYSWWYDDQRHREGDLPAIIDEVVGTEWYRHGKRHRDGDLPALHNDAGWQWYTNDVHIRASGPKTVAPMPPYDKIRQRLPWDWNVDPSAPGYRWCSGPNQPQRACLDA